MIPVVLAAAALAASPFAPNHTGLVLLQTATVKTHCDSMIPSIVTAPQFAPSNNGLVLLQLDGTATKIGRNSNCAAVPPPGINLISVSIVDVCGRDCDALGDCASNCKAQCNDDCACNAVINAVGDPHMINVLGEQFNLGRSGDVELLKVPRGAMASEMNFSMHALVDDLGDPKKRCLEAPYITSLTFRGKWFGDRPVFADMRDGNLVAFVGDQELQRQRSPLVVGRISESKNVSIHMPNEGHVVIRIGGARIDVVRDVRPVHFFLNMQARSLSDLGDSIGGILGQDDHSDYADAPDCDSNSDLALHANGAGPIGSSASASLDF